VRGIDRYHLRYYYYDDYYDDEYEQDPTVCYSDASGLSENGTSVSKLGYFICPYDYSDKLSDTYCCGPDQSQTCCGFWDNGGRMAGAIIGIILGVGCIVGVFVWIWTLKWK